MDQDDGPSADELRNALATLDDARRARRIVAGLLYDHGLSGPDVASVFDVRVATVYAWLDRLEGAADVLEAVSDRPRPGRPPRLTADQREQFREALEAPPGESGIPGESWTAEAAQRYLEEAFDATYSLRHVRRLLEGGTAVGGRRPERPT